jgi:hypothetical protein
MLTGNRQYEPVKRLSQFVFGGLITGLGFAN